MCMPAHRRFYFGMAWCKRHADRHPYTRGVRVSVVMEGLDLVLPLLVRTIATIGAGHSHTLPAGHSHTLGGGNGHYWCGRQPLLVRVKPHPPLLEATATIGAGDSYTIGADDSHTIGAGNGRYWCGRQLHYWCRRQPHDWCGQRPLLVRATGTGHYWCAPASMWS